MFIHPEKAKKEQVLDELVAIYEGRATGRYGLSHINQRAHALQSGQHARTQGLASHIVVAALLHDIGHMLHTLGSHPAAAGIDDRHEDVGADWLSNFFEPAVCEPVRLHVAAKRYLCTVEPEYFGRLTRDSVESLELQGGQMSPEEVIAFKRHASWKDAVLVRRIDELAKDPHAVTPDFIDFAEEIMQSVRAQ